MLTVTQPDSLLGSMRVFLTHERRRLISAGLVCVALGVGVAFGRAVALGGDRRALIVLGAGATIGAITLRGLLRRAEVTNALAVEVPLVLVLFSTLTFRQRSTFELAYNPLDPAASVQVAFLLGALMLGLLALLGPQREGAIHIQLFRSGPMLLLVAYAAVVIFGVPLSSRPLFTLFRALELITAVVVIAGAYRAAGERAIRRIESTMYWSVVALVGAVWVGRFLWPDQAVYHPKDLSVPIRSELTGLYPQLAANGVGLIGVVLYAWSLARVLGGRSRGGAPRSVAVPALLAIAGLVTVIAAQYRTGYLAVVAATLVLLAIRHAGALLAIGIGVVMVLIFAGDSLGAAQPYVLRGQSVEEAQTLSGRLDYWNLALPVWRESPVFGRGLRTASRFEVLTPAGFDDTAGLHSTWVEALVGTGLAGVGVLVTCYLVVLRRTVRGARAPGGPLVPLALVTVLGVRSLTGNSFESLSLEHLLFAAVLASLAVRVATAEPEPTLQPESVS